MRVFVGFAALVLVLLAGCGGQAPVAGDRSAEQSKELRERVAHTQVDR